MTSTDSDKPNVVLLADSPVQHWYAALLARHVNLFVHALSFKRGPQRLLRLYPTHAATRLRMPRPLRRAVYRLVEVKPAAPLRPDAVDLVLGVDFRLPVKRVYSRALYALLSLDTHVTRVRRVEADLARLGYYDVIYTIYRGEAERLRRDGLDARHIDYGVDNVHFYPRRVHPEPEPFFVGSVYAKPFRKRMLEALKSELEKRGIELRVYTGVYYHSYSRLVSKHILAINIPGHEWITYPNFRTFEVPGSRGLLINYDIPGTRDYLEPWKHYIPWREPGEAADAVVKLLEEPEKALEIARAACRRVWSMYTLEHSLCRLLRDSIGYRCEEKLPLNAEKAISECNLRHQEITPLDRV